ncbi:YheC/YheD family protein [Paenibacillus sp. FSL M7-0831]|uniref:YheC/YheD family protein n=1 Tax=Paenibacillus sp. FSL M7-0831 TaxID=2975314 RepID=UPI0030F65066
MTCPYSVFRATAKTKVLMRNKQISAYIPLTMKYSQDALNEMLQNEMMVYIKPDVGTYGNGVMCAERFTETEDSEEIENGTSAPERYRLHYGTSIEEFDSLNDLHRAVRNQTGKKIYLIQHGIAKLKQIPFFDLRRSPAPARDFHPIDDAHAGRT